MKRYTFNPTLGNDIYYCDVEARTFGDRIDLYGTSGRDGRTFRVYSSDDMVNWTDHGAAFSADDVKWIDSAKIWAPDCVCKDGRYYLYYCVPTGELGVAVSDCPYGPFKDLGKIEKAHGIDPAVLVDDDGQAYLYWGQLDNIRAAKLKDNMREIEESTITQPLSVKEHEFHEGGSVRKVNGRYYYVYTDTHRRGKATAQGYAVSDNPLTGFQYKNIIVDNFDLDPKSWNNHGCIQDFKGQWYIFYHRATHGIHSWGQPRQLCIERIYLDEQGEIAEVLPTTSGAGMSIAAENSIPAACACGLSGKTYFAVDTESKYGLSIKNIEPSSTATFRYIEFDGETEFALTLKGEGVCRVELYIDGMYCADSKFTLGIFFQEHTMKIPKIFGKKEITLKFFGLFDQASCDRISFSK